MVFIKLSEYAKKHKKDGLKVQDLERIFKSELDVMGQLYLLLVGGGLVGGIITYLVSEGIGVAERTGAFGSILVGTIITLVAVFLFWAIRKPLLGFKLRALNDYVAARKVLEEP